MAIYIGTQIISEQSASHKININTTNYTKVYLGTTKVWEKQQRVTLYSNYNSGISAYSISNIFSTYSKVTIYSEDTDSTSGVGIDSWVFTDYGQQIQLADGMTIDTTGIYTWSGMIYEIIAEV
jgi:hypothetical protein